MFPTTAQLGWPLSGLLGPPPWGPPRAGYLACSEFLLPGKFGDFSQTAPRVGKALLLLRHWGPVGPPAFLWFGMLERTARNAWEFLLHFPPVFLARLRVLTPLPLAEQSLVAAPSDRLRSLSPPVLVG